MSSELRPSHGLNHHFWKEVWKGEGRRRKGSELTSHEGGIWLQKDDDNVGRDRKRFRPSLPFFIFPSFFFFLVPKTLSIRLRPWSSFLFLFSFFFFCNKASEEVENKFWYTSSWLLSERTAVFAPKL